MALISEINLERDLEMALSKKSLGTNFNPSSFAKNRQYQRPVISKVVKEGASPLRLKMGSRLV